MKFLILSAMASMLFVSGTASAELFLDRPRHGCDPVWESVVPVYRTVKHRRVLVGYQCVQRQPNGGPSTGGSSGGSP